MSESTHDQHAAETKARWGETDAYSQSTSRTKSYSEADWVEIKSELESIEADFAEVMEQGVAPDEEVAVAVAERARLHIDQRYYTCSHAMHAQLADMYVADERFKAHYDTRRAGLAEFVSAAIKANAEQQTA